jgi:hypothetical protein
MCVIIKRFVVATVRGRQIGEWLRQACRQRRRARLTQLRAAPLVAFTIRLAVPALRVHLIAAVSASISTRRGITSE